MKTRETDRLIHNIAVCVQKQSEGLHNAEKEVRAILERSSREHNIPLLFVARDIWKMLKENKPRKTVNHWCATRLGRLSFAEFEYQIEILRRYSKKARNLQKVKEEKGLK